MAPARMNSTQGALPCILTSALRVLHQKPATSAIGYWSVLDFKRCHSVAPTRVPLTPSPHPAAAVPPPPRLLCHVRICPVHVVQQCTVHALLNREGRTSPMHQNYNAGLYSGQSLRSQRLQRQRNNAVCFLCTPVAQVLCTEEASHRNER